MDLIPPVEFWESNPLNKSLQNKSFSRNLDIHTSTKIYFIYLGVRDFFEQCISIFEVGIWTSVQHKNVNDFLSFLFKRARFKRGEFKFILIEEDCDMICREGYVGVGNPHVHLKHINNIWEILKGAYYARNIMIVVNSK